MRDPILGPLAAELDARLSQIDRDVREVILDRGGRISLDDLADLFDAAFATPKEHVFAAVARLERFEQIPSGLVR